MSVLSPHGLARRSVGTRSLLIFAVSASAPMTVVVGGIVTGFATTGVVGLPLGYALMAVVLLVFAVGYVAMARDTVHTATFYAFLARGLGRGAGVAGGFVAVAAYNALQLGLYGLFGATASQTLGGAWWLWALGAWVVVAVLGAMHVQLGARLLAVALVGQIALIVALDAAGLFRPALAAGGSTAGTVLAGIAPTSLFTAGVGGALTLVIASYVGIESVLAYGEEADRGAATKKAVYGALAGLGVLYTVTAWALVTGYGAAGVIGAAQDTNSGIPFALLGGSAVVTVGQALVLVSIFAALVTFHNVIARYIYGMAREGMAPRILGGRASALRDGVPAAGSLAQSLLAGAVIGVFAISGIDPLAGMFAWLTAGAALGVLTLMVATCMAVIWHYRAARGETNVGQRLIAPATSGVALLVTVAMAVANLDSLVGPASARWALPLAIPVVAAAGLWTARRARRIRPGAYAAIGHGQPQPLAVVDRELAEFEL